MAKTLNPSFSALYSYRIGSYYFHSNNRLFKFLGSRMRMKLIFKMNCDISFLAKIGDRLRLPHPLGVVIGAGVEIGNNVIIFQNVTLGSDGKKGKEKSYPKVGDNVIIYADSIILGNVKIGDNSVVGAKTFVTIDVPPNSLVIGNPCKIIIKN
ncbi:serine acetyltransferase [Winogradskyella sp. DF17]|uniref:Serine acetyltransferase n=1 Tax=Winogradskyella pelagia TaxID=2819984 RepID=A0ABS3T227_9FLAO|nr:serine acetyltransferase [Winogradskyella sp. DF17]